MRLPNFKNSLPPAPFERSALNFERWTFLLPANPPLVGLGVLTPPSSTHTPRSLRGAVRTPRPTNAVSSPQTATSQPQTLRPSPFERSPLNVERWAFLLLLTLSFLASLHAAAPASAPPAPIFRVISAFPKYNTADIEFRDPSGTKWPSFFYGKPATETGFLNLTPTKPAATFTLLCDKMSQDRGDQSRKVLGELCAPEKSPAVTLTITAMTPPQDAPATGKDKDKSSQTSELTGTLELAGRKIPIQATTKLRHHTGKGDEKNTALLLDGRFTLTAAELGLKALPATAPIAIRFGLTAYPPTAAQTTKGKK